MVASHASQLSGGRRDSRLIPDVIDKASIAAKSNPSLWRVRILLKPNFHKVRMRPVLKPSRAFRRLDRLALSAQRVAQRKRTAYWAGALVWMLFLQASSVISTVPLATLIPVSFPILAWIKGRVEQDASFQVWFDARLGAEIARVLDVFASSGKSPTLLIELLARRLHENRANPPAMIMRLLTLPVGLEVQNSHASPPSLRAWIDGQSSYLSIATPHRERQVRFLNRLSWGFYGLAIMLALIGIGAALLGYHFLSSGIQFFVFTAPAVASVVGIFYSDLADTKDIARYRFLDAQYKAAILKLDTASEAVDKESIFDNLAYLQMLEVIDWWKARIG
jgi:hypothetical protein